MGTSLFEGLKSFDSQLCTQCCSSLDFILTHAIAGSTKAKKDDSAVALTQLLSQQSHLYCQVFASVASLVHLFTRLQILRDLLNTVIFEECKHQWSISRPMLGLIIMNQAFFVEVGRNDGIFLFVKNTKYLHQQEQRRIISSQPQFKQATFESAFAQLMDGVSESLATKNRDHFTQNLAIFRRDVNNYPKSAADVPLAVEYMN